MLDRKAIQEQIEPQIQDNYVTVKVTNGDIAIAQDNVDDNGIITLPSNEYNYMITENEKDLPYANQIFLDVSEVDLTPNEDTVINGVMFKNIPNGNNIVNPIYDLSNTPLYMFSQQDDYTEFQYTVDASKTFLFFMFKKVNNNIIFIFEIYRNNTVETQVLNIRVNRALAEMYNYSGYIYTINDIENITSGEFILMQFVDEQLIEVISTLNYVGVITSATKTLSPSAIDFILSENSFDFSNMDMPWLQPPPTP